MNEGSNDPQKTADRQRDIQREVDQTDKHTADHEGGGAMQAGARIYPVPPFKEQRQSKPGIEDRLDPLPMYDAPFYKGSGKLENKVAIITGGDSGIGRAVAVLFAREGADIAISYLEEADDAEETRNAVENEGRGCLLSRGDVRDPGYCKALVQETLDRFGGLDILVNNAAFQIHAAGLEDLTDQHFDETLKTNLYGLFNMSKAAVPHLKQGSAIVNSGSVVGLRGSGELLDYAMTKGGIHSFTRSLASRLIKRGIRVNAVAPGPVWTPLNPSDRPADEVANFGSSAPMGRPAQPEELAPAYVFLASPHCSSYITGEILPVIGGY